MCRISQFYTILRRESVEAHGIASAPPTPAPCNPALNIGKWEMGNGSGVSMNRGGSTTFGTSDSNIKSGVAKGWGALPLTFRAGNVTLGAV